MPCVLLRIPHWNLDFFCIRNVWLLSSGNTKPLRCNKTVRFHSSLIKNLQNSLFQIHELHWLIVKNKPYYLLNIHYVTVIDCYHKYTERKYPAEEKIKAYTEQVAAHHLHWSYRAWVKPHICLVSKPWLPTSVSWLFYLKKKKQTKNKQ